MPKSVRAFLLVFMVLVEGLGSAWATAPTAGVIEQKPMAMAAMPCHHDTPAPAKMPCCDDQSGHHCDPNCLGSLTALVPPLSVVDSFAGTSFSAIPAVTALPLAFPNQLLRPPAALLS